MTNEIRLGMQMEGGPGRIWKDLLGCSKDPESSEERGRGSEPGRAGPWSWLRKPILAPVCTAGGREPGGEEGLEVPVEWSRGKEMKIQPEALASKWKAAGVRDRTEKEEMRGPSRTLPAPCARPWARSHAGAPSCTPSNGPVRSVSVADKETEAQRDF